jgi:hypothetical protein
VEFIFTILPSGHACREREFRRSLAWLKANGANPLLGNVESSLARERSGDNA